MNECLFCKIAAGELPSEKHFEDDEILAIEDIHPKAPVHLLIIPKQHNIESINDLTPENVEVVGKMLTVARELAAKTGVDKQGYKLLFNVGEGAGQSVMHLHLHLMGKLKSSDKLGIATE